MKSGSRSARRSSHAGDTARLRDLYDRLRYAQMMNRLEAHTLCAGHRQVRRIVAEIVKLKAATTGGALAVKGGKTLRSGR